MGIVTIDEADPAVRYVGSWAKGGIEKEYKSTTHATMTVGRQAILDFKGSSVSVFGTIPLYPEGPTTSSYSIDGSPPTFFTTNPDFQTLYKQRLYTSPQLDPSKIHTIVVSLVASNETMFWLDYFEVTQLDAAPTGPNNPNPPPANTPPPQTTPQPGGQQQGISQTNQQGPSQPNQEASSQTDGGGGAATAVSGSLSPSSPFALTDSISGSGQSQSLTNPNLPLATTVKTSEKTATVTNPGGPGPAESSTGGGGGPGSGGSPSPVGLESGPKNKIGIAVGSALAGVVVLAIVAGFVLCVLRRRRRQRRGSADVSVISSDSWGVTRFSLATTTNNHPNVPGVSQILVPFTAAATGGEYSRMVEPGKGGGYTVHGGSSEEKTVNMLSDGREQLGGTGVGAGNMASDPLPTYQMAVEGSTTLQRP